MIKYLIHNEANLHLQDSTGRSPYDLLQQENLTFLADNLGVGYESSTVLSSSKKSHYSNSSSKNSVVKNREIVVEVVEEECVDKMFSNIRDYFA